MSSSRAFLGFGVASLLTASLAYAQAAGSAGGLAMGQMLSRLAPPEAADAERVITIEGVAEVRVAPTDLRIVLAHAVEAASAAESMRLGREGVAAVKAKLVSQELPAESFDVDFIAVLPVHAWNVEEQSGREVIAERRVAYRVQQNLYVRVPNEESALATIAKALEVDGVEVLAVNYWNAELPAQRQAALEKALAVARRKADLLLEGFAPRPVPINVHESCRILFPQDLYRSFARSQESEHFWNRELPQIPATRPQNTYYMGLYEDLDAGDPRLPSRREIHVVATVRLYFAAPGREKVVPSGGR